MASTAGGWSPTHVVPTGGMAAWDAPVSARPPVARLSERVELLVTARVGAWAQVRASNGWSGWVDGRLLVECQSASPMVPASDTRRPAAAATVAAATVPAAARPPSWAVPAQVAAPAAPTWVAAPATLAPAIERSPALPRADASDPQLAGQAMAWFQKDGRENSLKVDLICWCLLTACLALPFYALALSRIRVGSIRFTGTLSGSSTNWYNKRAMIRFRLPKTLKGGDEVTVMLDGRPAGKLPASKFWRFFDGTRLYDNHPTVASVCSGVNGDGSPSLGTHEMKILDSMGNVLAAGSYTITP